MSGVAGVVGIPVSDGLWSLWLGALEEEWDSDRLTRVTAGGLQRSYRGSPEALRSCRVLVGAMMAVVTIAEWASNTSTGRRSLSNSGVLVDQM